MNTNPKAKRYAFRSGDQWATMNGSSPALSSRANRYSWEVEPEETIAAKKVAWEAKLGVQLEVEYL